MRSRALVLLVSLAALILSTGCGIQIIGPEDGRVVSQDEAVVFEARGLLGAGSMREVKWHSSIDGDLGRGDALKFPGPGDDSGPLSAGEHTITAQQQGPFGIVWDDSILVSVASGGRPPPLTWVRSYGGAEHDAGSSIVNTVDGGYLVAGSSDSFSHNVSRLWLLKLDAQGEVLWKRTYGTFGAENVNALLQRTVDGGFVVAYEGLDGEAHVLRLTSTGAVDWKKVYALEISGLDPSLEPTALALASDGSIYLAGRTNLSQLYQTPNAWMMRLNAVGDVTWSKRFEPAGKGAFKGVDSTSDGGAVAVGYDPTGGPWMVKTDASGSIEWQRNYGPNNGNFHPLSVTQTRDGGYLLTGRSSHYTAPGAWVVRLDSTGAILWNRSYSGYPDEVATAATEKGDGEFVVTGAASKSGHLTDLRLFGLDPDGNLLWERRYGGTGVENAEDVVLAADGGITAVGRTSSFGGGRSDVWVVKAAGDGSVAGYCPWSVSRGAQVHDISTSSPTTDVVAYELTPTGSSPVAIPFDSQGTGAGQCPAPEPVGLAAQNLEVAGNTGLPSDPPGTLGQTFTPTRTAQLVGIEVSAVRCDAPANSELSLELTEGGTSLGSVSIGASEVSGENQCGVNHPPLQPYAVTQVYFDLTPLNHVLTEGGSYAFTLSSTGFFMFGASFADIYAGGTAIHNGTPEPDQDLAFKVLVQP